MTDNWKPEVGKEAMQAEHRVWIDAIEGGEAWVRGAHTGHFTIGVSALTPVPPDREEVLKATLLTAMDAGAWCKSELLCDDIIPAILEAHDRGELER
jgi:hypothetical protein